VRASEIRLGRVGPASIVLDPDERAEAIRVTTDSGTAIPFTLHHQDMQLFAEKPVVAHIASPNKVRVVALTLPDVAEAEWSSRAVPTGVPVFASFMANSIDLWQWLACAGALGLALEWWLFGRSRFTTARPTRATASPAGLDSTRGGRTVERTDVSREEVASR
jgi:hypothetical protein